MKLHVIAVGQKLPDWAQSALDTYSRRFPAELALHIKAIKTEPRHGGKTAQQCMQAEAARIQAAMDSACPRGRRVVALDERGRSYTTLALAQRLTHWQQGGDDVVLLIGGPDGLHPPLRDSAHECLRLSDLTLPHALARVLLVEQLYRAWSVNAGHPYHRE